MSSTFVATIDGPNGIVFAIPADELMATTIGRVFHELTTIDGRVRERNAKVIALLRDNNEDAAYRHKLELRLEELVATERNTAEMRVFQMQQEYEKAIKALEEQHERGMTATIEAAKRRQRSDAATIARLTSELDDSLETARSLQSLLDKQQSSAATVLTSHAIVNRLQLLAGAPHVVGSGNNNPDHHDRSAVSFGGLGDSTLGSMQHLSNATKQAGDLRARVVEAEQEAYEARLALFAERAKAETLCAEVDLLRHQDSIASQQALALGELPRNHTPPRPRAIGGGRRRSSSLEAPPRSGDDDSDAAVPRDVGTGVMTREPRGLLAGSGGLSDDEGRASAQASTILGKDSNINTAVNSPARDVEAQASRRTGLVSDTSTVIIDERSRRAAASSETRRGPGVAVHGDVGSSSGAQQPMQAQQGRWNAAGSVTSQSDAAAMGDVSRAMTRPAGQSPLGFVLGNRRQLAGQNGIEIVQVRPGSPAAVAGLREMDFLMELGHRRLFQLSDVGDVIRSIANAYTTGVGPRLVQLPFECLRLLNTASRVGLDGVRTSWRGSLSIDVATLAVGPFNVQRAHFVAAPAELSRVWEATSDEASIAHDADVAPKIDHTARPRHPLFHTERA